LELYRPHLIIGCGRAAASPARMMNRYVLPPPEERRTTDGHIVWWRYSNSAGHPFQLEERIHGRTLIVRRCDLPMRLDARIAFCAKRARHWSVKANGQRRVEPDRTRSAII
jgi:hypothetical protein